MKTQRKHLIEKDQPEYYLQYEASCVLTTCRVDIVLTLEARDFRSMYSHDLWFVLQDPMEGAFLLFLVAHLPSMLIGWLASEIAPRILARLLEAGEV